MRLSDVIHYTLRHMKRRQLRSWLTILGIIIGMATIVVLVSVGEGVKKDINEQLELFGADKLIVVPMSIESIEALGPMSSTGKLFEQDIEYLKRIHGIDEISEVAYGRVGLRFKDKEISAMVMAGNSDIFDIFSNQIEIESGRYIQKSETKVVFLMHDAANELFGKDKVRVNNYLYINEEKYRVVGIAKELGSSMSSIDDSALYVPYSNKDELFGETLAEDEISLIIIDLAEDADPNEVAGQIEEQIASAHRISVDDKDFSVVTQETLQNTVNQITDLLTGSLFLIGLISAIVGGIGIANTMFMSVVERTKEIGVLKSIGATSHQILLLFLTEAGLVGGIGGLIGLGIGMIAMTIIPYFGVVPYLAPEVAVGVVFFAIIVGMVSGFIPARNASKIHAIEALKYD